MSDTVTMSAKVIPVIVTDLATRGAGVEGDPVRRIRQIWSLDGQLLAEVDPCAPKAVGPGMFDFSALDRALREDADNAMTRR